MARPISLLALFVVFSVVLPSSTAVKCYKCSDLFSGQLGAALDGLKGAFDAIKDVLPQEANDGAAGGSSEKTSLFDFKNMHPSCKEFDPSDARFHKEDCEGGCMKVVQGNGDTTRDCSSVTVPDRCGSDGDTVSCICTSDYCNAAGRSAPALTLLLLLPAALLALLNSRL